MGISELIEKILLDEYNSGKTQWDLAKKYNISQTQIQKLLSGQRKVSNLTLGTVQKMFPSAIVDLSGSGAHQFIGDNSRGVQLIHTGGESIDAYRMRVQDKLLEGDDPVDVKRVLKIMLEETGR